MRAVATVSGWIIALALAVILFLRAPAVPVLVVGEVRQDVQLDPLPLTMTNQPLALLDAVNTYRASPGWIASSNERIYAGLVDRVWSAPYTVQRTHRHAIGVWAGSGGAISYTYVIFDRWTLGGMVLYAGGSPGMLAGVGYRW